MSCAVRAEPEQPDDVLAADLTAVLMAAQEPPAAALTWLLLRVGADPHVADRVEAGGQDRAGVVRETLRLRPAAIASIRRLTTPFEAAGRELQPGTVAMVPIPLVHRDARAFPRPGAFLPERWTDGASDEKLYMPFGGGARRCLGEHLAQAYVDVVLPAILRVANRRPAWPQPERMVVRGTILVPHRGGLMAGA